MRSRSTCRVSKLVHSSPERAANVCYQELDVPTAFPVELRQYLPNVAYGCDQQRCVFSESLAELLS